MLIGAKWAASLLIDYSWWQEMGQVRTWIDLYAYSTLPVAAATIFCWIVLLIAHSRGVHFAGGQVSDYPIYSRISALALLGLSFIVADASIDNWTVLRFVGSRAMDGAGTFHDPIFGKPATFYLFDLPFWTDLRGYLFAVVILTILTYWLVARGWQLRFTLPELPRGTVDLSFLRLTGGLESRFLRGALAFFLRGARGALLPDALRDGVESAPVHDRRGLHRRALRPAALLGSYRRAAGGCGTDCGQTLGGRGCGGRHQPGSAVRGSGGIAGSLFVKPNEISLERPYIQAHIEATRAAYGLAAHVHESKCTPIPTPPSTW